MKTKITKKDGDADILIVNGGLDKGFKGGRCETVKIRRRKGSDVSPTMSAGSRDERTEVQLS